MMMTNKLFDDRYRLIRLVAEGGTSFVFRAEDKADGDKKVAIKILKPEFANDEAYLKAFIKEVELLMRLDHDNIVKVRSAGRQGTLKYFAMDFVEGVTLKSALRKGTLSLEQKLTIAIKICGALQYAHKKGVIHKDIKPENILLTEELEPIVSDFGIANEEKMMENSDSEVFGTVQYFSPEQARGERTDAKTDIYSTGVILYEMFCGVLPFTGNDSVSVALKHLHQIPADPKTVAELPESLNRIILKALRKNKSQRYRSMKALKRDLELALLEPGGEYVFGYRDKEDLDRNSRSIKNIVAITASVTFGVVAFVVILLGLLGAFSGGRSSQLYMPSLAGRPLDEVEDTLGKLGLNADYSYEQNVQVSANHVIAQMPDMGTLVYKGDTVTIVLSSGNKILKEFPNLIGFNEIAASDWLYDMGFSEVEIKYVEDPDEKSGAVVAQSVEENEWISVDTPVSITVNTLSSEVDVNIPNLIGKDVAEAMADARQAGFESIYIIMLDADVEEGKVLSQFPTPDMTEADTSTLRIGIQEYSGKYRLGGTVNWEGDFSVQSVVTLTAMIYLDGEKYEFILFEGSFENKAEFSAANPDGINYDLKLSEQYKNISHKLCVYINHEVVYTEYVYL